MRGVKPRQVSIVALVCRARKQAQTSHAISSPFRRIEPMYSKKDLLYVVRRL